MLRHGATLSAHRASGGPLVRQLEGGKGPKRAVRRESQRLLGTAPAALHFPASV